MNATPARAATARSPNASRREASVFADRAGFGRPERCQVTTAAPRSTIRTTRSASRVIQRPLESASKTPTISPVARRYAASRNPTAEPSLRHAANKSPAPATAKTPQASASVPIRARVAANSARPYAAGVASAVAQGKRMAEVGTRGSGKSSHIVRPLIGVADHRAGEAAKYISSSSVMASSQSLCRSARLS